MRRLSPLALVSLVASGCGSEPTSSTVPPPAPGSFRDRTATVLVGQTDHPFTLDSCGYEGQTFRLTGSGAGGETLEAVAEVEDDGKTVVFEATGISVTDVEGVDLAAYGPDAWEARGRTGEPPGEVLNARVNGVLLQVAGTIAVVDEDEQATSAEPQIFSLDAFCDDEG